MSILIFIMLYRIELFFTANDRVMMMQQNPIVNRGFGVLIQHRNRICCLNYHNVTTDELHKLLTFLEKSNKYFEVRLQKDDLDI